MRIRFIDDYYEAKKKISPQITSNSMYKYHFEYLLEDLLSQGKELDLITFKDGSARLKIRPEETNLEGSRLSTVKYIAVYPREDGGFRVTNVQGNVSDSNSYYSNPTTGSRPNMPVNCVLNVSQKITNIDADGVELESVDFFTNGIPIEENCFNDPDIFIAHALSKGVLSHDGNFDEKEFEKSKQSYLSHDKRDPENPAIVTRHHVQKDSEGETIIEKYSLGVDMSKFPELLRLDEVDIFATKDREEDDWEVSKTAMRGGEIPLEEAIKNATVNYGYNLEVSNTKRENGPEYEPLRKRCDTALEQINHRLSR